MTPSQITLVQESFAKVAPISDQAAVLFYDRLFEVAPPVRAMFPEDLTEQRKKLMGTLAVVVGGLSNLDTVLPAASALAKRHVNYGAKPEHYPVSAPRCCGRSKRGSARLGPPRSPKPGPRPTARCPAT